MVNGQSEDIWVTFIKNKNCGLHNKSNQVYIADICHLNSLKDIRTGNPIRTERKGRLEVSETVLGYFGAWVLCGSRPIWFSIRECNKGVIFLLKENRCSP